LKRWDKMVGPFLLTAVFPLSHAFFSLFSISVLLTDCRSAAVFRPR
jgi:hypothetical protein